MVDFNAKTLSAWGVKEQPQQLTQLTSNKNRMD